ncbi:MAG: hypothetical protein KIH01_07470 [Candidatus Freyarchaeota archaeon]|nr:hypothetical protein [Candidatus Jordarchaeia archaeon]
MAGLKDLEFEEALRVIRGDEGFLARLLEERRISKVEGEILRACSGVVLGDESARTRLRELAERHLGARGYDQLTRFLESTSRVSWMVFVKNYELKGGYEYEAGWSLEEHRAKFEVVRVSLVEYVERVKVREGEGGGVRGGVEGS